VSEQIVSRIEQDGPQVIEGYVSPRRSILRDIGWLPIGILAWLVVRAYRLTQAWDHETLWMALIAWALLLVAIAWIIPGAGR